MKQELWLMHQLQIIHFDIKNENIVYSPHFQKPVFIDFGFSDVIKEKNGFKTLSSFKGTPNFCTREMLALIL
jgi:serine/threonine protein kinase